MPRPSHSLGRVRAFQRPRASCFSATSLAAVMRGPPDIAHMFYYTRGDTDRQGERRNPSNSIWTRGPVCLATIGQEHSQVSRNGLFWTRLLRALVTTGHKGELLGGVETHLAGGRPTFGRNAAADKEIQGHPFVSTSPSPRQSRTSPPSFPRTRESSPSTHLSFHPA